MELYISLALPFPITKLAQINNTDSSSSDIYFTSPDRMTSDKKNLKYPKRQG